MVTAVIDYLIVVTDMGDDDAARPAGSAGPISLPRGVRIEQIDYALGERMLDACELRGERWSAVRQYSVIQAFVREVPQQRWREDLYGWDAEGVLYTTLTLSRLIRPHATAFDHTVRRIIDSDGTERLAPNDAAEGRVAFRVDDGSRNWLDIEEAERLAALLEIYDLEILPQRVRRALAIAEFAVRERYLEGALPLIVAGLEALTKIGRQHLSAQFAQRTSALATSVGIALDQDRCSAAYDDRSGLVHGGDIDLSVPAAHDDFMSTFDALQRTLRAAVRTAIEQPGFAAIFNSDDLIRERWPTTINPRRAESFVV
jgi:hypothetical protein